MLIKEYRIPLPLTVEEYRIAQLYMIAVSITRRGEGGGGCKGRGGGVIKILNGKGGVFIGRCLCRRICEYTLMLLMMIIAEKEPRGDERRRQWSGDNS